MKMLSELFIGLDDRYKTIDVNSVHFLSSRVGSGETLNFFEIQGVLYLEDYKGGGREDSKKFYDLQLLSKPLLQRDSEIFVDEALIIMHTDDNPGHTFSNLINALYIYKYNNLNCILIIPQTLINISRQFLEIILMYVPFEKVLINQPGVVVNCNLMHCYIGSWFFKYSYNGNFTRAYHPFSDYETTVDLNDFSIGDDVRYFKNLILNKKFYYQKREKIALIKSTKNRSSAQQTRSFSSSYDNYLLDNNYFMINPESSSVFETCLLLNTASEIITSWGAISFLNKIFFNPESRVTFLVHIGYENEYLLSDWQIRNCYVPICNKVKYLFNLDSDLNSDVARQIIYS